MIQKRESKASDGEEQETDMLCGEQETGMRWKRAGDRQVMEESKRQANDGEEQETGK